MTFTFFQGWDGTLARRDEAGGSDVWSRRRGHPLGVWHPRTIDPLAATAIAPELAQNIAGPGADLYATSEPEPADVVAKDRMTKMPDRTRTDVEWLTPQSDAADFLSGPRTVTYADPLLILPTGEVIDSNAPGPLDDDYVADKVEGGLDLAGGDSDGTQ